MTSWHYDFLSGVVAMGFLTLALFFAKFWKRTHDSFFLAFACAFVLMAANAVVATYIVDETEQGWSYLLRLAAFILIIVAIVLKNLGTRRN